MKGKISFIGRSDTRRVMFGVLGVFLLLVLLASRVPAASAEVHFTNCASNTGSNATVGIPAGVVMPGSFTPQSGDEIAVFRPNGSLCVGSVVYSSGGTSVITVWGDNTQTGVVDGIQNNEIMQWRIWDASANREYFANVVYNAGSSNTTGAYTTEGIFVLDSLTPNGDKYAYEYANEHADTYGNKHSDKHTDPLTDSHGDEHTRRSNGDKYANAYGNEHACRTNRNEHADAYGDKYACRTNSDKHARAANEYAVTDAGPRMRTMAGQQRI